MSMNGLKTSIFPMVTASLLIIAIMDIPNKSQLYWVESEDCAVELVNGFPYLLPIDLVPYYC